MKIDYEARATLHGTAPASERGGKLAEGSVAKMVAEGLAYIGKGYINVRVMHADGSLDAAGIKEVAASSDFPRL